MERLTAAVEAQATSGPFAALIAALTSLRGVGVVTAVTLVAELGDPGRFDSPRQLMAYAGVVPSEHSSGGREQRGRITKTGNAHVRYVAVEAAWHCRRKPHRRRDLARRQRGQSAEVVAIAWTAQERLHERYVRLGGARASRKPKAAVAVARELLGFVWAIARQVAAERAAAAGADRGVGARRTGVVGAAEERGRDAGVSSVRPWRRPPADEPGAPMRDRRARPLRDGSLAGGGRGSAPPVTRG